MLSQAVRMDMPVQHLLKATGLAIVLALIGSASLAESLQQELEPILQSDIRSDSARARDRYRHPAETLAFFDVGPDQTVVEIWPGKNGWYTAILAPLLRENGQLYCAHWNEDSSVEYFRKGRTSFDQILAQHPSVYDRVQVTVLEPLEYIAIAPPGSADRVLTFRNVHNWIKAGKADAVFQAMFKALKPGGILGVVEHRAVAGTSDEEMIKSGYVTELRVVELAQAAGFELVAAIDINANPKDDAHHPYGVWSLPPSLRGGDVDREKYLAIGESDRMTLKFRKPLQSAQ